MSPSRKTAALATAVAVLVLAVVLVALRQGHDGAGTEGDASGANGAGSTDLGALGAATGSSAAGNGSTETRQDSGVGAEQGGAGESAKAPRAEQSPGSNPLDTRPLPRTASSHGRLVAGYPSRVLPTLPASRVRTSSVSNAAGQLQVALVAATARPPGKVALFYRQSLTRLGFKESEVAAAAGSTALGFSRGQDSVTITITATGKRATTYSMLGTLHAGKA